MFFKGSDRHRRAIADREKVADFALEFGAPRDNIRNFDRLGRPGGRRKSA